MKTVLLFILLVANTACVAAPKSDSSLSGIDVFGSKRLSAQEISQQYGPKIKEWAIALNEFRPEAFTLDQELCSAIKNQFGLAYVGLSLITYYPPKAGRYLTVDVVEPEDAAKRIAFLPEPTGRYEDPDGLIALWDEYAKLAVGLQKSGEFQYPKTCPAWHCTYGFEHPKLAPFLEKLNSLAPVNEAKLARILKDDARAQFRANAAFLLAHIKDGPSVTRYVLSSIRDSSSLVRNNAIRVLSEISNKHPELDVPVAPVLQVLEFPATTDRNKAAYTLVGLSKLEKNKSLILRSAGNTLIEMLKLTQPNNHDPAYELLVTLSGEHFGERDYAAWEKWIAHNQAQNP